MAADAGSYRGLLGAFAFAARRSRSWVCRSYVVVSALVGGYVGLLLVLAMVTWLANPSVFGDRAFLAMLGLVVLIPLFAPVLVVARRHRLGVGSVGADRLLGLAGYAFVASVFLALFISDPADHGVAGPGGVVAAVDGLPRVYGVVPPVLAIGLIAALIRLTAGGRG